MTITEAQQFREMLLRVKSLELEHADILRRLDAIEAPTEVRTDHNGYVTEIVKILPKRGPGRPRKNGN